MTDSMDENSFWAVIEATTAGLDSGESREETLRSRLSAMTPGAIKAFHMCFDELMSRSYTWDLWGAAYVIHGGCSDDGFEYFRRWLISRGRETFEAALSDPETLADVSVEAGVEGMFEFESIYYAVGQAYEGLTGNIVQDDIDGDREFEDIARGPVGEQFEESERALASRFPRLSGLYGAEPLPR